MRQNFLPREGYPPGRDVHERFTGPKWKPLHCPTCGAHLDVRPIDDANAVGFRCAAGHLFYSFHDWHGAVIPMADTIDPPAMADDRDILRFWLVDPRARLRVPNQLAVVLRRILEKSETGQAVPHISRPFNFCAICGERFVSSDNSDGYMCRMSCVNDHVHWERGGTLYPGAIVGTDNLSIELYDDYLPRLIDTYLTHDTMQPYVHPQIRELLGRYQKRIDGTLQ